MSWQNSSHGFCYQSRRNIVLQLGEGPKVPTLKETKASLFYVSSSMSLFFIVCGWILYGQALSCTHNLPKTLSSSLISLLRDAQTRACCLPNVSSGMSHRHLELHRSKIKLFILSLKPVLPVFSFAGNTSIHIAGHIDHNFFLSLATS